MKGTRKSSEKRKKVDRDCKLTVTDDLIVFAYVMGTYSDHDEAMASGKSSKNHFHKEAVVARNVRSEPSRRY